MRRIVHLNHAPAGRNAHKHEVLLEQCLKTEDALAGPACACPIKHPIANSFPSTRLLKTKPGVAHKPVSLTSFGFTTRYAGVTELVRLGMAAQQQAPTPARRKEVADAWLSEWQSLGTTITSKAAPRASLVASLEVARASRG